MSCLGKKHYRWRSISSTLSKAPFRAIKDFPGGSIRWLAIISSFMESFSCKKLITQHQLTERHHVFKEWQSHAVTCRSQLINHYYYLTSEVCITSKKNYNTFMRDSEETTLGKFWLISCIDCKGSEACTIRCAVWCPKSVQLKDKGL